VDHPVVKGVIRPVDGKKITEGWGEKEEKEKEKEKKAEAAEAAAAPAAAPGAAAAPAAAPGAAAAPAQQPAAPQVAVPQLPLLPTTTAPAAQPQIQIPTTPAGAPVKIILKDANITIGKIILKRKEEK